MEEILGRYLEPRISNYTEALERLNEQLVFTLKKCVELLELFKPMVGDPLGWQEMLDMFQDTIKVAESTIEEKALH